MIYFSIVATKALTLSVKSKTHICKSVFVRAGVSYKALGFHNALTVVVVSSGVIAGIKLLGTWQKIR